MAKVRVRMRAVSANANRILDVGKVYLLPEAEAESLLARGSGPNDAPAAELYDGSVKGSPITKPDPGEKEEGESDDD